MQSRKLIQRTLKEPKVDIKARNVHTTIRYKKNKRKFTLIYGMLVAKKFEKKITIQNYFSGLTCASVAIGLFKRMIKWIDDTDQFCTVGAQRHEHQFQLPPNYSSCILFVKLVFKGVLCIFGIHSPSTIFFSVSFIYFLAHNGGILVYVFRTFGIGKEGKDDESEAHMVYSDHERAAEKRFNVSIFISTQKLKKQA